jgi:hypothetical protein
MKTHHSKNTSAYNIVKKLFLALIVMFSVQVYAAEKPAHGEDGHDHSKDKHNHVEGEGKQKPSEDKHDHSKDEDKHDHGKGDEHSHSESKHDDHEHGSHADTTPTSRSKGK